MSNHFLEGKLRISMKWVKTSQIGELKRVLKVS